MCACHLSHCSFREHLFSPLLTGWERIFSTLILKDIAAKYTGVGAYPQGKKQKLEGSCAALPVTVTPLTEKTAEEERRKGQLAARNSKVSFCLQQNRNWEGRHGRGGWNNVLGKQRGFLSAGGDLAQLAAPGTHAFSPGRVAKGAGLGDRPRAEDGRPPSNKVRWIFIYSLMTESF